MIINEALRKWFGLDAPHCESCDILQNQLDICNAERQRLLTTMLEFSKPVIEERPNIKEIQPIQGRAIPWRVRQQMLEENDRAKAEVLRKTREEADSLNDTVPTQKRPVSQEQIEEVEKQLGIK